MEREAEQPALAAGREPVADVEERFAGEDAVPYDADLAALFDHEDAPAAVAGVGHRERIVEAVDDALEGQPDPGRVEPAGRGPGRRRGCSRTRGRGWRRCDWRCSRGGGGAGNRRALTLAARADRKDEERNDRCGSTLN